MPFCGYTFLEEVQMNRGQQITLIGAVALIIAAFLPWISATALFGNVPGVDESIAVGWEGDGIITGGIGLVLIIGSLLFRGRSGKRDSIAGAILGLLACSIVLSDFLRIAEIGPNAGIFASTGIGLYVTFVGAIVAVIGGLQIAQIDEAGLIAS
jgi:hypothetical protein